MEVPPSPIIPLPPAAIDSDNTRTVFVGNLPREVSKREIEEIFGEIGPIKRCYIQYPRGEKRKQDTTVAYVTYAISEDAAAAIKEYSQKKIGGNKVILKLSVSRTEQSREVQGPRPPPPGSVNSIPIERPKPPRPKPINKKSRLIIRNLPFQLTDEKLKTHFASCGEIKEVNILRKPNGKMVGCAFLQYENVHQAIDAIQKLNFTDLMGRTIAVDWALPKKTFQKGENSEENGNQENGDVLDVKIKEEPLDDIDMPLDSDVKIKSEDEDEDSKFSKRGRKTKFNGEMEDIPKKRVRRNDVEEGKTLFIRNLEFETTETDMQEFFKTFGEIEYALICKDKLTEHPKGTGFVKFKELNAANECLKKSSEEPEYFKLGRRQFYLSPAMSKERLTEKAIEEKAPKEEKDKRNLYLAREGFIRPGSEGAEGVSTTDMNLRASLTKTKKQMLRNLNIFVSDNRLCVHNLSPKYTDENLRKLFTKHSPPGSKLTEAKIMRDLNDVDIDGVGKSKGFGFVTFTQHEHALQALRKLNNNPNVFSQNKRPIVEFSLENRAAVKAKQKRTEKSKENNVNAQKSQKKLNRLERRKAKRLEKTATGNEEESKPSEIDLDDSKDISVTENTNPAKKLKKEGKKKKNKEIEQGMEVEVPKFSGLTAKEGISKLPMMKPKGKITRKSLKPSKKKKKQDERRMREPKLRPKNSHKDKEDAVDRIVSRYKQQQSGEVKTKQKWYA